ncbi:Crp/Fnr family transcriptional regulator [Piscinibacter terrae]|nr:Crp/Fnr family transcriptional regulator [Albitalea terrae]
MLATQGTPFFRAGNFLLERSNLGALMAGAFGRLPQSLRSQVLEAATMQYVPARSPVFGRDEPAPVCVGVVSGAVRLGSALVDGRNMTLDVLGPGDFFADLACARATHDLETIADSRLVVLKAEALRRLMQREPDFTLFVAQTLSSHLQVAYQAAAHLLEASLEERTLIKLLDLSAKFGVRRDDEVCIDLPIVQQDIADMVGCSRQRLNVAVRELVLSGTVRLSQRPRRIFLRGSNVPARVLPEQGRFASDATASSVRHCR